MMVRWQSGAGNGPVRLIYACTMLLILVLLATNAAVILHLRETELRRQDGKMATFSLILAEQADRSFETINLIISSVAERLAVEDMTGVASFKQKMANHDTYVLLREKVIGIPQLDAIIVINSDGIVINSSRSWPTPDVQIPDRLFFNAMKDDPNLKTNITEPVKNRTTGTWTVYLAHRVSGQNGEFLGLILGAVQLRYFDDFYRAISLGEGSSVALLRLDGLTLTRFPRTDTVGVTFANAELLLNHGVSGVLRHLSPINGKMGIVAVHRLANYPVLALATTTEEAALTSWQDTAQLMSLGAFGCAISIAVAGFALGRQWENKATIAASQAELRYQEDRTAALRATADVARTTALKMTYMAEHDFLTGLPNRMLLDDRTNQAIAMAQRHGKHTAVLFMDLDGFKHINDSLGHRIGDKLLQSIAQRLLGCVRDSDTVSRQGGDEFVVLLSEVSCPEDASIAATRIVRAVAGVHSIDQHEVRVDVAIVAGKILRAVADAHSIDHHDLHVTASIGISIYPDDGLDAETLIKNADTAMYQAKENGRQNFQFFRSEMNIRAVRRQSIEEGLRRALERREFSLHYQPIVDLKTGLITGAEALVRWMHPTLGSVPPAQFIPIAEYCGLILPIGAWVLHEACVQARLWADAGLPVGTLAVNLSVVQLTDKDFLDGLFAILAETSLDPSSLVLELTETVLMKHAESAASTLRALREKGVQVAIDDFGTGYSSLSYLRKLPLDILKIDKSFIGQLSASSEDTAIVIAVINMARSLRLRVIAEGVERLEELTFLRAHQCDEAQGYYFSKPVIPRQFAELLRNGLPELDCISRLGPAAEPATATGASTQRGTEVVL
jgi:diguanylate cyclase (GGDEF)-like protein